MSAADELEVAPGRSAGAGQGVLRLYHERESDRPGALDARDEEECFTAGGRAVGVYLTSEALRGPNAWSAEVDTSVVEPFETTSDAAAERTFVVPGPLVATLGFAPNAASDA